MLITTVISGMPLLTSYNRKYNVLSASLNKTVPSFLLTLQGHVTSFWQFIMVLVSDTENASYFFQSCFLQFTKPCVCACVRGCSLLVFIYLLLVWYQ